MSCTVSVSYVFICFLHPTKNSVIRKRRLGANGILGQFQQRTAPGRQKRVMPTSQQGMVMLMLMMMMMMMITMILRMMIDQPKNIKHVGSQSSSAKARDISSILPNTATQITICGVPVETWKIMDNNGERIITHASQRQLSYSSFWKLSYHIH